MKIYQFFLVLSFCLSLVFSSCDGQVGADPGSLQGKSLTGSTTPAFADIAYAAFGEQPLILDLQGGNSYSLSAGRYLLGRDGVMNLTGGIALPLVFAFVNEEGTAILTYSRPDGSNRVKVTVQNREIISVQRAEELVSS